MNPLAKGFYTVPEAARLIEVGSATRIRGWLNGYRRNDIAPLLHHDYHRIGKIEELSFFDLMEVRFVEFFRQEGVRVPTLRRALEEARKAFNIEKPLASDRVRFTILPDKKQIIVDETDAVIATAGDDKQLWQLMTRQREHYELIKEQLVRGVTFDPRDRLAQRWKPRPIDFPDIEIEPTVAYGRPHLPSGKPTAVVYDYWLAANKDLEETADWMMVKPFEAQMAIEFERALRDCQEVAVA